MIKSVRGTRDLLPPETALWNFVESAVRDVFRAYNFQEIRTPIFEETALFARSVGDFSQSRKPLVPQPGHPNLQWMPGIAVTHCPLEGTLAGAADPNRRVR